VPTDRRPNFFIVGAQKSGTSALVGWLGRHPEVFMSFPKEPGYLAFGDRGYRFPDGYGRRAPASQYVIDNEADYLDLFSQAGDQHKILGEASTWYFTLPGMADKIRNYSPDARILVILRNPIDRAYSAWGHARRDNLEPCTNFRQALDMETERGEVEFLLRYHRMGLYSDALADYQRVFPASRLLVLLHEDLRRDPAALWRRLCEFLAIDPGEEPPQQRNLNRSGLPRSGLLQRVLGAHRTRVIARKVMPYRLGIWAKERLDAANLRKLPEASEEDRAYLRAYYREDVEKLAHMLGRDLCGWLD
jgi:hypothetical protein